MYVLQEPLRSKPKCRVELHIHLDGAIRPETIWELMRQKRLPLPGKGSLRELKEKLSVQEPVNLDRFLKAFSILLPAFKGDLAAIERFSYEFVEDQAVQSVAYCEARFVPHLFLPDSPAVNGTVSETESDAGEPVTAKSILQAVLKGLKKGEEDFGTKVRLILCCLRGRECWSEEILSLCEKFLNDGVVGIDIAGEDGSSGESQNNTDLGVFEVAKAKGIHRTIHAGEESGWESVKKAIVDLGAERIGHGYRVLENEEFYQKCLESRVHFEMCPHSSYMTGAIDGLELTSKRHPILRLAEDRASFSINSDDPTITGTWIGDEYDLLRQWGFTEAHFVRANFEAALNCFLPPDEKEELIATLREAYGVVTNVLPTPSKPYATVPIDKKLAISIAPWKDRTVQ